VQCRLRSLDGPLARAPCRGSCTHRPQRGEQNRLILIDRLSRPSLICPDVSTSQRPRRGDGQHFEERRATMHEGILLAVDDRELLTFLAIGISHWCNAGTIRRKERFAPARRPIVAGPPRPILALYQCGHPLTAGTKRANIRSPGKERAKERAKVPIWPMVTTWRQSKKLFATNNFPVEPPRGFEPRTYAFLRGLNVGVRGRLLTTQLKAELSTSGYVEPC
jgi:hypothetical protein